jgi:hypothetical protein
LATKSLFSSFSSIFRKTILCHTRGSREYRGIFILRVHQLLKLGYDAMNKPAQFSKAQEEDITGELVQAIDDVLDDPPPAINAWADSFFAQEERRVRQGKTRGKRRGRMDIAILSSENRPRARFCFEAKRLGKGHAVGAYLGPEGLGAYLSGAYEKAESDAGMLGYVQDQDEGHWVGKIAKKLADDSNPFGCASSAAPTQARFVDGPQYTYASVHTRKAPLPAIRIYHTLLLFR